MTNKSGIHINPANKGLFTKKAKAEGKGVQEFAKDVLKEGSQASTKTKREAVFAQNAKNFKHSHTSKTADEFAKHDAATRKGGRRV